MIKNFSIYKASAGSGKTYILTYHYIRLALLYPDYFKSVLAVTFTNKATEEMKSRILATLQQLAQGGHVMSDDLKNELQLSSTELSARADRLLRNILHNYSFFAVTTIDAFFQKIVRSFAREIGIQTGFKIELDQPKVISEVIDQMLAEMAEDKQLIGWLTNFAIYQINQGKSWDTRQEIKNLSNELFNEFLVLNKNKVFALLNQEGFIEQFINAIDQRRTTLKEGMKAIGEEIDEILDSHQLSLNDFTYKAAGVGGYMEKLKEGEFIAPGKRVYAALEEGKWYSKGADNQMVIDAAIANGLDAHLSEGIDYYFKHNTEYQSLLQVIKYIYTFGLLSRISDEINNYREANDLLLISDFPVFLNEIINDSDAPYIYEKVGTRYKHYLIDEFQDTSGLQWNNFKPLVQETLSAGNFSMVVGDIKQSIYRWRGGNWKILLDQIRKDIGEEHIQDEGLSTNRRSKQNIVQFNNDLFNHAPAMLESHLDDRLGEAINAKLNMRAAYQDSAQELFDESGDGLIDIYCYDKEEEDADQLVIDRLIGQLQALQDANYQLNDIAILVRTNPQGRKITKGLMAYQSGKEDDGYRFDIISNESLYIKNNAAVHLILQSLDYVANPDQPLAQAQLTYSHQQYLSLSGNDADFSLPSLPIDQLSRLNLSQMVQNIIHHFDLHQRTEDNAYVLAFQDLILDYLKFERDTLVDFMRWWKDHDNRSIQVSDDQQAIRLMTVHKSKGLQFKVVIVPYCEWKLDHAGSNEQLLWCETGHSAILSQVPYVPVRYKNDLTQTEFAEAFYLEKSDIYLDNLNLLYVALTRAEEALYLMAQINPNSTYVTQVGEVLYQYCKEKSLMAEGELTASIGQLPAFTSYEEKENATVIISENCARGNNLNIQLRKKAHILDERVVASINQGEIIHWIYSLIHAKSDFAKALTKAQIKFGLSDQEMSAIKDKLREIWELPQVADWFDTRWKVKNESSILLTNGKMKRPDRVIVAGNKAIVIDYKTGKTSDRHQIQVREYKEILNEMGYQQVEGYLLYLSAPEIMKV